MYPLLLIQALVYVLFCAGCTPRLQEPSPADFFAASIMEDKAHFATHAHATAEYREAEKRYFETESARTRWRERKILSELLFIEQHTTSTSKILSFGNAEFSLQNDAAGNLQVLRRLKGNPTFQPIIQASNFRRDGSPAQVNKLAISSSGESVAAYIRSGESSLIVTFSTGQLRSHDLRGLGEIREMRWKDGKSLLLIANQNSRPASLYRLIPISSRGPQLIKSYLKEDQYLSFLSDDPNDTALKLESAHGEALLIPSSHSLLIREIGHSTKPLRFHHTWRGNEVFGVIGDRSTEIMMYSPSSAITKSLVSLPFEVISSRLNDDNLILISRNTSNGNQLLSTFHLKELQIRDFPASFHELSRLSFAVGPHKNPDSLTILEHNPCYLEPKEVAFDLNRMHLNSDRGREINSCIVRREWAKSKDSTSIPLSIARLDKPMRQIVLEIYAAYGKEIGRDSLRPLLPILRREIDVGYCHARGGGYLGHHWHRAAVKGDKYRALEDLEACIQRLRENGYESIVLRGRSAGATLALLAANNDSKITAVIAEHPLTNVIEAIRDKVPHYRREQREWGVDTDALRAISPFHALTPKTAVNYYFRVSENDSLIPSDSQLQFIARLRSMKHPQSKLLVDWSDTGTHLGEQTSIDESRAHARTLSFIATTLMSK